MKDKAINSFSLNKRIEHNEKNQRIDINKWAFKLISKDTRPLNILELCCGTGRQSEYLINHYINSSIDLLKLSFSLLVFHFVYIQLVVYILF